MEPTNNTAERALRPCVIGRKLSFGTDSERGSRYLERIASVCATLHLPARCAQAGQRGGDVLEFLIAAVEAVLSCRPAPSLTLATHPKV